MSVSIAPPREPQTPEEWQNAVDAAQALLALDTALSFGLVMGHLEVEVARCEDLLARAALLGYEPEPGRVHTYIGATVGAGPSAT